MKEYIEFLLQMDKMETHQDITTWNFRYAETKRKSLKSSRKKKKSDYIQRIKKLEWSRLSTITFVARRKWNNVFQILRTIPTRMCQLQNYYLGSFFHFVRKSMMTTSSVFLWGWSRCHRVKFSKLWMEGCKLVARILWAESRKWVVCQHLDYKNSSCSQLINKVCGE